MPLHNPAIHQPGKSVHIEEGPTSAVCDWKVVNLGQVARLARFREATAKANVRLQNIHCLLFHELAKAPAMTFHLPGCNRYFRMRPKVCESSSIVLLQRLLEPSDVALFDRPAKEFGLYRVEQIIGVDHDVDVVAHGVADRANTSGIFAPTLLVHSNDNFQGSEALRQLQLCGFA